MATSNTPAGARVEELLDRIESIREAAGDRPLTGAQRRDNDQAVAEILGIFRGAGVNVDKALRAGYTPDEVLENYKPEYDREMYRRNPAAMPDGMDGIIASQGARSWGARDGGIAHLWTEYRTGGFAAMDAPLSRNVIETRALATPGGSAIPTTFVDQVVVYQRTLNPMLDPSIVTISTSASGEPFRVPRLTADISLGGTVTAEAAAITEGDPTLSYVELTPYKYSAINLWSAELDQDAIVELQPLIARSTAREIALDAGAHLTTGDGNSKPNGIVTAAGNGGTAQGTALTGGEAFFGWPDLLNLMGQVAAPYRSQGSFMVSSDAFTKILGFRDTTGQPVLSPGLQSGVPTLFGRPVIENPAMASVGSASKSVLFGDFSAYWVRRVTPLRVELSRDYRFSTDQVALKTVDRLDGDLIDTAAVKYLVSANS